mmetsp:Transcript_28495/g.82434  ORF Transcript_28495/g.82434 Transcript_28495/m.82434 type:complete len:253 (-) Transcript_28495:861-1619(-)
MSGGNSIKHLDTDDSFGKGLRGDRIQFFPAQGASNTTFQVINRIMGQWLALGKVGAAATRGIDWTHNSTPLGNGYCGLFAIASHHENIDSTTAKSSDGLYDTLSWWIFHADHAGECEVIKRRTVGHAQDTKAIGRHSARLDESTRPTLICKWSRRSVSSGMGGALGQHCLWHTFYKVERPIDRWCGSTVGIYLSGRRLGPSCGNGKGSARVSATDWPSPDLHPLSIASEGNFLQPMIQRPRVGNAGFHSSDQ